MYVPDGVDYGGVVDVGIDVKGRVGQGGCPGSDGVEHGVCVGRDEMDIVGMGSKMLAVGRCQGFGCVYVVGLGVDPYY